MSRAFVREDDGSKPEDLPEMPVSAAPNLVTAHGLRLIERTIADLEGKIAETSDEQQLARLRRDLRYWSLRHATARLTAPDPRDLSIQFGSRVRYVDPDGEERVVVITGEDEADPSVGTLSYTAPVARALTGLTTGGIASVELAGRTVELEVLRVEVPDEAG